MDDTIYYIQILHKASLVEKTEYLLFNYEESRNEALELIQSLLELTPEERDAIHHDFKTATGKIIHLKNIIDVVDHGAMIYSEIKDEFKEIVLQS